jgi:hypothetical protein
VRIMREDDDVLIVTGSVAQVQKDAAAIEASKKSKVVAPAVPPAASASASATAAV